MLLLQPAGVQAEEAVEVLEVACVAALLACVAAIRVKADVLLICFLPSSVKLLRAACYGVKE